MKYGKYILCSLLCLIADSALYNIADPIVAAQVIGKNRNILRL